MKGLSKTELTGLMFLLLIVAGILITGFVVRKCDGKKDLDTGVQIFPIPEGEDSLLSDVSFVSEKFDVTEKDKSRKTRGKNKNKMGESQKKPKGGKSKSGQQRDPFSDTVPRL